MIIDTLLTAADFEPATSRVFELAADKVFDLDRTWDGSRGTPVFTSAGKYTSRGWTEWTQGFQFGSALLAFDATNDSRLLELGRRNTLRHMTPHVSHIGVHDHGFNNISTYGNLRRLMRKARLPHNDWELAFYDMALKVSGAVQAARWTAIPSDPLNHPDRFDAGFIHSFNGAHSLFSDTIRSVRSLIVAWQLGHSLMAENDRKIDLLRRGIFHGLTTARYNVYFGQGRDIYDTPAERGRVVHESIFNITDGRYRCPSTQQGYSPFSTWTRGLAWVLCGFAEQLEFLEAVNDDRALNFDGGIAGVRSIFLQAARATADWWLGHSFADGLVYWDAGAGGIAAGNDYSTVSDPYNDREPMDSSAAAIAAQGFLRLGRFLADEDEGVRYTQAGLTLAKTLFAEPYLSTDANHQGLLLHSVYHRPNGWDYIPPGRKIPCGESSMWGDYHLLELALMIRRAAPASRITPSSIQRPRAWPCSYSMAGAMSTENQVALITGGSRGIGLGIARELAANRFNLVLNGRRPTAEIGPVIHELTGLGSAVLYLQADVADLSSHAKLLDEIRDRFGRLDLLVNNAGVAPNVRADLLDASPESFDRLMAINLRGPYFLTQAAARWMIEQRQVNASFRGCIVNVSSVSATAVSVNRGDYCISKAGVAMATQLWAARLAEFGIEVYEVRPGLIATDMTAGVSQKYDKLIAGGLTVQKRWGTPEDVGRVVAALARGDIPYATGQVFNIDGGMTIQRL